MATLPAQTRRFKLRISAILCKNSSDLFLDTKGSPEVSAGTCLLQVCVRVQTIALCPSADRTANHHKAVDGSETMMTKVPAALLDRLHASVKATNDICSKAGDVGRSEEPAP